MPIVPNNREYLINRRSKVAKLQLRFAHIALLFDQDDLAKHGRRHERYTLKVKQHFALRLVDQLQQLSADLGNKHIGQNLLGSELNNQDIVLLLRNQFRHLSAPFLLSREKQKMLTISICTKYIITPKLNFSQDAGSIFGNYNCMFKMG